MKNEVIADALMKIAEGHNGELKPADVVEAARPKSSPLHSQFQWDDTAAAEQYRLFQARNLIRVTVHLVGTDEDQRFARVFVSLTPDRANKDGGGYRTLVSVMSDRHKREQLLQDALDEMKRFEQKYAALKELAVVFAAMRKVRRKTEAA